MSLKGVHRHIKGTICALPTIPMYSNSHVLDEDRPEALEKIEEKWDLYNQHEALIKAQILTIIPDVVICQMSAYMQLPG